MMDRLKNLLSLLERMYLDKRPNLNFSFEHQGQRVGVLSGRTSPISTSSGIEGHQIREAYFDCPRGIANDGQVSPGVEQAERSLLPGRRPAGFEDLEPDTAPAALLGERPYR